MAHSPKLFNLPDRYAWHTFPWKHYAKMKEVSSRWIIQPVFSLSEWGLGRPLDAEEVIGSEVLCQALQASEVSGVSRYVLPPLRLTPKQSVGTCFGLDIEQAHTLLREQVMSACQVADCRLLLFNSSPFLEEWIDVAARDLRVDQGYSVFCINLSGIGLDFDPARAGNRSHLQSGLSYLLQKEPEEGSACAPADLDPLARGNVDNSVPKCSKVDGQAIIAEASEKLANLLIEIEAYRSVNHADAGQGGTD